MVGLKPFFLAAPLVLAAAACSPPRPGFDAPPEGSMPDVQMPDVVEDAAMDVAMDVRPDVQQRDAQDVQDATTCDPGTCDSACMSAGLPGGVCRGGMCQCIGGATDGGMRDAGEDAVVDAGIRTCVLNTDCPPTTFCNGAGCMGPGFCSPRSDPASCDPDAGADEAVCGCDGMRYASTCHRLAAGVRLDPAGTCLGGGDAGGD